MENNDEMNENIDTDIDENLIPDETPVYLITD
jgi:hypothetical protein